ncbi:MAG: type II toxin-antitoxin system PemK/MazF family toxin [Sporolactobacillus sp.]
MESTEGKLSRTVDYVPDRGDILFIDLLPKKGHEQAGSWPAIVLTPKLFSEKTGLFIACPITSKVKGYSFEVKLPETMSTKGVVLADQIKTLDWRARQLDYKENSVAVAEVCSKLIGKILMIR